MSTREIIAAIFGAAGILLILYQIVYLADAITETRDNVALIVEHFKLDEELHENA